MNQVDFTQLGLAGAMLSILFFIVKYFVTALAAKDTSYTDLANKLLDLSNATVLSNQKLADAIQANTVANKQNIDTLTALILQLKQGSLP